MATSFDDYTLRLAKKHVDAFDALMAEHRQAKRASDCEELLRTGIEAYHWLKQADDTIRQAAVEGFAVPQEVVGALAELYRAWLKPCSYAEEQIRLCQSRGYSLANLDEFRRVRAAVEQKTRVLALNDDLDAAFRGEMFDAGFWSEAHRTRNP